MADFHPIITNFTAGEISPTVYGRVDIQRYGNGVKTLENFLIQPQGGLVRRPGFRHVCEVKDSSKKTRVVNFEFSSEQAYILEFGHQYIRFFKNEGQITSSKSITGAADNGSGLIRITATSHGYETGNTVSITGVGGTVEANALWTITVVTDNTFDLVGSTFTNAYTSGGTVTATVEIASPYTENQLFDLSFTQSADVLYICHESHWPRKLNRTSHTAWDLVEVEKNDGPYLDMNEDDTLSITTSVSAVNITDAVSNGGEIQIEAVGHGLLTGSKTVIASVTGTTEANGTWYVTRIDDDNFILDGSTFSNAYISGGTSTGDALLGTVTLTATESIFESGHVGSIWRLEESSASKNNEWKANTSYSVSSGERVIYEGRVYEARTTATSGNRPPVHETGEEYDGASNVLWRYLHQGYGVVEITAVASGTSATGKITTRCPNSCTSGTIRWREGAWSTKRGFPRCVCFFEERLVFAGTTHQPQTTWMSRSGDYEVFSPTVQNGEVQATTAITYTISSNKVNSIQWISSGSVLVFGTIGEEWQAFSGKTSEPMTPDNIQVKPQTSFGSDNVKVMKVGSAFLFVQRSGRKLRELLYNYEVDSFVAKDLTLLSEHVLREGDYVNDAAYQQEPFSTWWGVRADGQLASMTYLRDQEVVGWHRHVAAGSFGEDIAQIESVAVIPNPEVSADQVWIVVKRTIDGTTKRYIEFLEDIFNPEEDQQKDEMYFLDSFLEYEQTPKTITGATQANPVVITSNGHGYSNGDRVKIEDVVGMTELNGKWFVVKNQAANTFELTTTAGDNIDGTGFEAYVSGGLAYEGVQSISGLGHLEGELVGVMADGAIKPNQVVSSGSISIGEYVIRAVVGLRYLSYVTTLRPEGGAQLGTAQGKVKRTNQVKVRLYKSLGLKYGALADYSEDLSFRLPEHPMDQSPPFFTGDKPLQLDDSYTDEGYLSLASDYPYPLNITAIMPELEVYEQR